MREDKPGDKKLVAYIVPNKVNGVMPTVDLKDVRTHLKNKLPSYMVIANSSWTSRVD